jgi:hypothetical protein
MAKIGYGDVTGIMKNAPIHIFVEHENHTHLSI